MSLKSLPDDITSCSFSRSDHLQRVRRVTAAAASLSFPLNNRDDRYSPWLLHQSEVTSREMVHVQPYTNLFDNFSQQASLHIPRRPTTSISQGAKFSRYVIIGIISITSIMRRCH